MKVLTDEELGQIRPTQTTSDCRGHFCSRKGCASCDYRTITGNWHEGSEIVGYWPEGDSYVFKVSGRYLAISRGFIKEALHDAFAR